MKICPQCRHEYSEDNVFFCLFDGEKLKPHNFLRLGLVHPDLQENQSNELSETSANLMRLKSLRNEFSPQEIYISHLKSEGYMPQLTEQGHIKFKREGKTFIILIDKKDSNFFNMVFPAFWEIEHPTERIKALEVINRVNGNIKCARLNIVENNIWAGVEMFIASPEQFEVVFSRLVSSVSQAVEQFVWQMRQKDVDFPSLING